MMHSLWGRNAASDVMVIVICFDDATSSTVWAIRRGERLDPEVEIRWRRLVPVSTSIRETTPG